MKHITKLILATVLSLCCSLANSQSNDTLDIQRNEKGKVIFARFLTNENSNRKMQNDTVFLKSFLQAKKEDGFRKVKEFTDEMGIMHKKFQQYYRGIKVENAEFLIHGKNGNIEDINGDFQDITIFSIKPSINEQQALAKALVFVGAKKYKWENAEMERFVKQNTNNQNATYYPKGELVISKDYLKGSNDFILSWKFTISSMEPNNEQMIYVDANNGDIINNVPLICDVNISCTAQTLYSGNQTITGDTYPEGNRLREDRNGVDIQTLNLQNSSNYANATDFANNTTNWTSGSWATFTQDQCALDAHFGAEKVLDFWRTVFTRNSINGSGLRVLGYVHYTPDGTSWAGAQWIGGDNSNFMQYGDGNSIYKPLTALDVSAHEFGHGITQFTCNLTAGTQESGALNEGFSDIWGACVEHWAAPSKQTWLMGEEIFYSTAYSCTRNLQDPKSTTAQEGQHPDTYHGSYWDYNGEPHTNSTVLSHWFYLLSQGGAGTNDIGSSFFVYGLGIDVAQSIAYQAELARLNSSADYATARTQTILAANDLYGANSFQSLQVANAWYAVGVGTNPGQVTMSGTDLVCYSGSTFTANNPPSGSTISWDVTPTLLEVYSGGTTATPTIRAKTASGSGSGTITVKFTSNGITSSGPSKNVWVGPYSSSNYPITGPSSAPCRQYVYYSIPTLAGVSSINWVWPSGWTYVSGQNTVNLTLQTGTTGSGGIVAVQATNTCAPSGSYATKYTSVTGICGYSLSVSPNPATGETTIELVNDNKEALAALTEWDYEIYDSFQGLKIKKTKLTGRTTTLNTSNWKDGVYIVRAKIGDEVITEKLIVKH